MTIPFHDIPPDPISLFVNSTTAMLDVSDLIFMRLKLNLYLVDFLFKYSIAFIKFRVEIMQRLYH